jgi:hypothetical protein
VLEVAEAGQIEKDPVSAGRLASSGSVRRVDYQLRDGARASQYVALAVPLGPNLPAFDRVVFSARSGAPMRISVQLRFEAAAGARWGRSVYLSQDDRRVVVPLDRLRAADGVVQPPPYESASSLLFVVDLANALPGSRGWFEIADLALARLAR